MKERGLRERGNNVAIKLLQLIEGLEYDPSVTEPIADILKAMRQRVEYEGRKVTELEAEVDRLSDAYHQFNEAYDALLYKRRLLSKLESIVSKDKNLKDMKLWEILDVYLSFVPEAQVSDILGFFDWIGYKATRQAVESVIKTHKGRFVVRKDGWDRFISLAGKDRHAASTKVVHK